MRFPVDRAALAPDLSVSRVLTGLWQIADMERDGRELDPKAAAHALRAYVDEGTLAGAATLVWRNGHVVQTAAVAQHHACGDEGKQVVDSAGLALHHAQ